MADDGELVAGNKETSLEEGSRKVAQDQQAKVLTPESIEFNWYRHLLQGFFEKLIRWKEIFDLDEQQENRRERGFSVFRSTNGLSIKFETSMKMDDPPDKLLEVKKISELQDPEHGLYKTAFLFRPGPAGRHLLVDPDNTPLEEVEIKVSDQKPVGLQSLRIKTALPPTPPNKRFNYRHVEYIFQGRKFQIDRAYGIYFPMTDAYAIALFNTLDTLIPTTTCPISQSERKISQKSDTPIQLPTSGTRSIR